ncbi:hypothetical protein E4V01_18650 [Methylorubrum sp. Q1]|uniref:hypothetical protein n=1 Tax=Methylorubrum sp. Q1 TaxID=2562453 RepID=UPI0010767FDE|nr:hypothetical protein [Methylorubrum sp. Q1]TFZ56587.1 hypothetical protein E4V01_18650 [Methylorubrum sp. Q1]
MPLNRREFLELQSKCLALASSVAVAGCDNTGTFTSLVVENFGADVASPTLEQTVNLSWAYNYDNPEIQQSRNKRVRAQRLIIKRLHLIGIAEQAIVTGQEIAGNAIFQAETRSFQLTFNGPIVVQLQGSFFESTANDGSDFRPHTSAVLSLRLNQELFCRAVFSPGLGQQNALYPYLGYSQDPNPDFPFIFPAQVEFTQFVAFHDTGTRGQVDLATRAPQIFQAERPFRALSFSALESDNFRTIDGSSYPAQILQNPNLGLTNSMLFAGAIVFNGEVLRPTKGQDPSNGARRVVGVNESGVAVDQVIIPIFLAVPMLFGQSGNSFTVADIHAGSAIDRSRSPQQQRPLVLTALSTPGQTATGNLGTIQQLGLTPQGGGFLHRGAIKGARLVRDVTTLNQDIFTSIVDILSLEWLCQFMRDDQLDQLLNIGNE